jgi:AraC-like DNA-binding protein
VVTVPFSTPSSGSPVLLSQDPRIRIALDVIDQEYADPLLSLERVSRRVRISRCYFSRLFKKRIGCGFHRFLAIKRAKRAMVLLDGTLLSIKEIAGIVGFKRQGDLSRSFKSQFGVSPSAYRKSSDEDRALLKTRLLRTVPKGSVYKLDSAS